MDEYLLDLHGTKAAMRTGYSPKTAASQASRLLTNDKIARAIAVGQADRAARLVIRQDRVLEVAAELLFVPIPNIGDLFDERDNLRPLHTLTRAQAAMIASIEVVKKNLAAGDGHTDIVHKVKVWDVRADKTKALELVMKHLGLLEDVSAREPTQVFIFPPGTAVDWGTRPAIAAKVGP